MLTCKICLKTFNRACALVAHVKTHEITWIDYKLKYVSTPNLPKCKMCDNKVKQPNHIYCSNSCKHSDPELNAKRAREIKNDKTKLLKCKICSHTTSDINNLGGYALKHLKTEHNINDKNFINYYTIVDKKPKETFKCPIDGCDWDTNDLDNKSGCFTTHLKNVHNISPEEFMKKFSGFEYLWEVRVNKINSNMELLKSASNHIKCLECGRIFSRLNSSHLALHGLTIQQYKDKYKLRTVVSETSSRKQSMITISQNRRMMEYYTINNIPMPWHNDSVYEEKVKSHYNEYIEKNKDNFDIYFDHKQFWKNIDLRVKCKKCGKEFTSEGRGLRCYICTPTIIGESKEETEIRNYIQNELGFEIEAKNRKILNGKEIDIYIPEKKIGIEYNGMFWHSELNGKDSKYHIDKTLLAEQKGVQLIHIFEDEWLIRKDIVKHRLKHILGKDIDVIYARKTRILKLSSTEKNIFLDKYHIQGSDKSGIYYGLEYNNEIVSVMTFGTPRVSMGQKTKKENVYELIRFASNKNVIGGASKLLKYFITEHKPEKIISYADRRWSNGKLYETLGFTKISNGTPNYWYLKKPIGRIHRYNYTKSKIVNEMGGNPNLTEWENMKILGFNRIWDCGSLKFELIPNPKS